MTDHNAQWQKPTNVQTSNTMTIQIGDETVTLFVPEGITDYAAAVTAAKAVNERLNAICCLL